MPARKPAPKQRAAAPEAPAPSEPGLVDKLTSDPLWLAGIGAVVVAFAGLVMFLRRRNRALPNDLDVTAIAEEADAGDAGRIPSEGFSMDQAPVASDAGTADGSFGGLFDDAPAPAGAVPDTTATEPAPFTGGAAADQDSTAAAAESADSLFDDDGPAVDETSQGDAPMNQDMDLPADRSMTPPPPPPAMGGSAAPDTDVARMMQEMERRMSALEAKLDESNEAREKLERQVAAQSEELRVQRAAIARTQRALRTMSRGDEDKATEPALRDGDTQAKTRVNV